MLLGILGASLLGKILTGKGVKQSNSSNLPRRGVMRADEVQLEQARIFNATSSFN